MYVHYYHTKIKETKYISRYELRSYTPLMNAAMKNDYNFVLDNVTSFARQFSAQGKTAL